IAGAGLRPLRLSDHAVRRPVGLAEASPRSFVLPQSPARASARLGFRTMRSGGRSALPRRRLGALFCLNRRRGPPPAQAFGPCGPAAGRPCRGVASELYFASIAGAGLRPLRLSDHAVRRPVGLAEAKASG